VRAKPATATAINLSIVILLERWGLSPAKFALADLNAN
jgi:hypothetical protein